MMQVCCDKATEAGIMQFSLKISSMCRLLHSKSDSKILRIPQLGAALEYGGLDFVALYRGNRETELRSRSQISLTGNYMAF